MSDILSNIKKPPVIYYHKDYDGIASAYMAAVTLSMYGVFGMHDYRTINYGEKIETVEGEDILFVDFTPPLAFVKECKEKGIVIHVIDHHMNVANKEVEKYITDNASDSWPSQILLEESKGGCQSRAFAEVRTPTWVKLVGERDVWDFSDPRTKPFAAYLDAFAPPVNLHNAWFALSIDLEDAVDMGKKLLEKQDAIVAALVKAAMPITIQSSTASVTGYGVSTGSLISEVGNAIATAQKEAGGSPLGIVWDIKSPTKIIFSFRSLDQTARPAAEKFGGGGHPDAAGANCKLVSIVSVNGELVITVE